MLMEEVMTPRFGWEVNSVEDIKMMMMKCWKMHGSNLAANFRENVFSENGEVLKLCWLHVGFCRWEKVNFGFENFVGLAKF